MVELLTLDYTPGIQFDKRIYFFGDKEFDLAYMRDLFKQLKTLKQTVEKGNLMEKAQAAAQVPQFLALVGQTTAILFEAAKGGASIAGVALANLTGESPATKNLPGSANPAAENSPVFNDSFSAYLPEIKSAPRQAKQAPKVKKAKPAKPSV